MSFIVCFFFFKQKTAYEMRISDCSDVCSSDLLDEQQLFDLGLNQIRPQLVTVPGVAMPFPSGGKQRQIQIAIDPDALQARGLSAQDVAAALANQTQINPVGFAKIGNYQYNVRLNNAPTSVEPLNDLPDKVVDGPTIRLRDVAHVLDGSAPQIGRASGRESGCQDG